MPISAAALMERPENHDIENFSDRGCRVMRVDPVYRIYDHVCCPRRVP